jgi:N-acetylmuramoyl-L-alanine amidase
MSAIVRAAAAAAALVLAGLSPEPPADEPVEALARRLELGLSRDESTGREFLTGRGLQVVLAPGLSVVMVNEEPRTFGRAVGFAGGRLSVPAEVAEWLAGRVGPRVQPEPPPEPPPEPAGPTLDLTGLRVAIDPGHGGKFAGSLGLQGLVEKEVNLDVALRTARALGERGAEVILTRTSDAHLSEDWRQDLSRRAEKAWGAHAFVSIHANSAPTADARGFEIFVREAASGEDRRLAAAVRAPMRAATSSPDRGVKAKNLVVIREAACPAILVEMDFLSNREGARLLASSDHRGRIAAAIAEGVARWRLDSLRPMR